MEWNRIEELAPSVLSFGYVDENEIAKFADLDDKWWDKEGDFKPLHKINPLRANYND